MCAGKATDDCESDGARSLPESGKDERTRAPWKHLAVLPQGFRRIQNDSDLEWLGVSQQSPTRCSFVVLLLVALFLNAFTMHKPHRHAHDCTTTLNRGPLRQTVVELEKCNAKRKG
jgi:hypothetical protein